jgi:enoyl-CoA hydratase/carnithine racemase
VAETLVRCERVGDVAHVRLDRPKVNALSIALLNDLRAVFEALEADLPGAVVISGGERVFSAGADVGELADASLVPSVLEAFAGALDAVARLPRAVIVAITGVAVGGGCELSLAADFRFAEEGARLGQPEILLGVIPGAGGTQRLSRLVGLARAKELVYTGKLIDAAEALRIGLIDRICEKGTVLDQAVAFAAELASGPRVAQGFAKQAFARGADLSLADALALERELFVAARATRDAEIGITSFLENGPGKATFVGE